MAADHIRWIPPGSGLSSDWRPHSSTCPVPAVPYVVTTTAGAGVGDFQRTLDAYRRCARGHHRRLKLLILGDPGPVLPRLARWGRRGADIEFLGEPSSEDRFRVLASARAFIVPSGGDQAWFSLHEALHAAIPVIVPRDDSLVELLGDAALQYSPEDSGDAASQIWRCLEEDSVPRSLAKRAISRARVFSWETYTLRLLDLFSEVQCEHVGQREQEAFHPWRDWRLPA